MGGYGAPAKLLLYSPNARRLHQEPPWCLGEFSMAIETFLQGANMEVFCLSLHCLHLPVQTTRMNWHISWHSCWSRIIRSFYSGLLLEISKLDCLTKTAFGRCRNPLLQLLLNLVQECCDLPRHHRHVEVASSPKRVNTSTEFMVQTCKCGEDVVGSTKPP